MTRRDLFQIAAAAPAVAAVSTAQTREPAKAAYKRKVFDEHQWRTVGVLSDLIIPADEQSGSATQVGVPEFIDDWLNFRKEQDGNGDLAAEILGGLAWLDREAERLFGKNFAAVEAAHQKAILDRIAWPARTAPEDHRWAGFFTRFRDLTANGFFSSKMGIADLPYLGNTVVTEWKGCDPAVWAQIEERMNNGYKGLGGEVKPWT